MVSYLIELPEIVSVALEVLAGKWSSGLERVQLLENAGYEYEQVQSCVNDLWDIFEKYGEKE